MKGYRNEREKRIREGEKEGDDGDGKALRISHEGHRICHF